VEKEEEPEPRPVTDQTDHFFIIAGSFKNLANASELQDKLKARGFPAEVMITENRMYRVSVASFPTSGEAERELPRFKSQPGLESCWLLANE
jgi:cell division protein FtsN